MPEWIRAQVSGAVICSARSDSRMRYDSSLVASFPVRRLAADDDVGELRETLGAGGGDRIELDLRDLRHVEPQALENLDRLVLGQPTLVEVALVIGP